jgi:TM2 domain-containing membrane protein YozV
MLIPTDQNMPNKTAALFLVLFFKGIRKPHAFYTIRVGLTILIHLLCGSFCQTIRLFQNTAGATIGIAFIRMRLETIRIISNWIIKISIGKN